MFKSKIVHLKKIYKFGFDYFLEKRTVFILIKKTLLKIKSCGFRPNNNVRYEKMLNSKIVHLKEIRNFDFDNFFIKRTVFVLIVKNVIKNKNSIFRTNSATYKKILRNKIVRFKKIYKSYFDHFLIGIIVFLINMKNTIK